MRSLLHFNQDGQGRWRISQAPPVGQTTIFSASWLLPREEGQLPRWQTELPTGMVSFPDLNVDSVITVDPQSGPTMTFRIVDIRPYEDANGDVPDPSIMVWYATRLT